MTLTDLLAAVSSDCGYEAIPSAVVTARLTRYVNEAHRHILSMDVFSPLRSGTISASSSPNRTTYGFPQLFVSIDQVVDVTNNIRLRLMTQDQFRTIDPQEVSSGTPTHYVPLGYGPTVRDPRDAPLFVNSTSAADTTQILTLRGVARGSFEPGILEAPISVTLNGLTPVQVGSFVTFNLVTRWALTTPAVGTVTLFDRNPYVSVDDFLGQITPGDLTVQYAQLRLWPTPSGTYQYQIDGVIEISDLAQPADVPLLPSDFQSLLADYARMREYEYRDDPRVAMAQLRYEQKLKEMRTRIMDPPDYRPRVGRIPDRSSNLGSFYPPGRW